MDEVAPPERYRRGFEELLGDVRKEALDGEMEDLTRRVHRMFGAIVEDFLEYRSAFEREGASAEEAEKRAHAAVDADEDLWSPVRSDYYLTPGLRLGDLARRHGLRSSGSAPGPSERDGSGGCGSPRPAPDGRDEGEIRAGVQKIDTRPHTRLKMPCTITPTDLEHAIHRNELGQVTTLSLLLRRFRPCTR